MAHESGCDTQVLAQSRSCTVQVCTDCGLYHVHMGPVSLRLTRPLFEGLCRTLAELHNASPVPGEAPTVALHRH